MNILIVGKTNGTSRVFSGLISGGAGACVIEENIFDALKAVYGRKFDAVIVSSLALLSSKLNFMGFVRERFDYVRLFVTIDNGINELDDLCEGAELIMSDGIDEMVCKLCDGL